MEFSMLSNFWNRYNSNESWMPLYLPLMIWFGAFLYCYIQSSSPDKKKRIVFHKWTAFHTFYVTSGMMWGAASILLDDQSVLNERVVILWNLGYFLVDFIDCMLRLDVGFSTHAIICIAVGISYYASPLCRSLRMISKCTLCELSTPLLYLSRSTRKPLHFLAFAIVFTFCRMLWVPYLIWELDQHGMAWTDCRKLFLVAMYGLYCFWYAKIIRILRRGRDGGNKSRCNGNNKETSEHKKETSEPEQ